VNIIEIATGVLLGFTVLICLLSGIALLVMRGFYDKLHYLAPPAVLATPAIVAAVFLNEGLTKTGVKILLLLLIMLVSNPVVTHAAARAKRIREEQKVD
jgi:multicomponent Na+:H+ antiporter subunit G